MYQRGSSVLDGSTRLLRNMGQLAPVKGKEAEEVKGKAKGKKILTQLVLSIEIAFTRLPDKLRLSYPS